MVHLAIDDHSRVSFAQVLSDEKAVSCVQFLREAVAYYASLGVHIQRVMTDNGKGFKNAFKAACDELGIRHIKTRPYTPKTNGKAERFVQTSLREWAYARPYETSAQREAAYYAVFQLRNQCLRNPKAKRGRQVARFKPRRRATNDPSQRMRGAIDSAQGRSSTAGASRLWSPCSPTSATTSA